MQKPEGGKVLVTLIALLLAFAPNVNAYTIDGDTITYANQYGSISQYPHTLSDTASLAYVSIWSNITATLNLDVAFGFDTSQVRPTSAYYWTGSVWNDVSNKFTKKEYAGKTYYVVENVSFSLNDTKLLKFGVDVQVNTTGKYDLWIKRSSDSWADAIADAVPNVHLDPWWNTTFRVRIPVSINSTVESTLTDFPAYFQIDHASLVSTYGCLANGSDIRLVNSTGSNLSFEIANGTNNSAKMGVWVRIPQLLGGTNYSVNLYCGNTSSVSNGQNPCDTWGPAGYKRVYHLLEGKWGGKAIDSSCNNNATYNGTANSYVTVPALFGNGAPSFLGTGTTYQDIINFSNPHLANTTGNVSISIWAWRNTSVACSSNVCGLVTDYFGAPDYGMILRQYYGGPSTTQVAYDGATTTNGKLYNNSWLFVSTTLQPSAANQWEERLYLNGTRVNAANKTFISYGNNSMLIGTDAYGIAPPRNYGGLISEFRYRNVSNSADWILAEYAQTYAIYGVEISTASASDAVLCNGTACGTLGALYKNAVDLNASGNCSSTTESYLTGNFTFYRNGTAYFSLLVPNWQANSTGYASAGVAESILTKSDTWRAGLICNGTGVGGSENYSSSYTVNNTAPVIGNPSINNTNPGTNSTLLCTNGTYIDADSDAIGLGRWRWFKNGAEITGNTTQALNLSVVGVSFGDGILCEWMTEDSGYDLKNSTRMNSSTVSIGIGGASIIDCSAGGFPVLNFTLWDEETNVSMNGTFEMTFTMFAGVNVSEVAFKKSNTHFTEVCINSYTGTVNVSSFQTYYSNISLSVYPQRNYFLLKATLNASIVHTIKLYLENTTFTKQTSVLIKDETGRGIKNIYLSFQRFFPETNEYKLVTMGKTNDEGYATVWVRPIDPYYRTIAYTSTGQVLYIFQPAFINCDPYATSCAYALQIPKNTTGYYWQVTNGITHSCAYSNSTGKPLVGCTYFDATGLTSSVNLTVYQVGGTTMGTVVCSNASTSTMDTLLCYLPTNPSGTYGWQLVASINPSFPINVNEVTFGQSLPIFGALGLVLTAFITIVMGILGASFGPALLVAFATIGFVFSWLAGLIALAPTAIVGVVSIALVLVYILRRNE